mgnify:CR=1 FL=1
MMGDDNGKGERKTDFQTTALEAEVRRLRSVFEGMAEGVITVDREGRVKEINPAAARITGWTEVEAIGLPADEVVVLLCDGERPETDHPLVRARTGGREVSLSEPIRLLPRDGPPVWVAGTAAPTFDDWGKPTGAVLVIRSRGRTEQTLRLMEIRLALIEYAADHSEDDLLMRALDLTGELVDSPVGFYHFVSADEKTLILQQWSSRTIREFCQINGRGMHYPVADAGVWVDCVRTKTPVIHNDYAGLSHRKGLPEGHAPVIRELVVPVLRESRVVAILGVGNKPVDYTPPDVEMVTYLADVTFEIVRQNRAQVALLESEQRFRRIYENMAVGVARVSLTFKIEGANEAYQRMLEYTEAELIGKHLREITHPEVVAENLQKQSRLAAGEIDHFRMEKRFIAKSGRTIHGVLDANLVRDAAGTPIYFLGSVVDITDRKEMEAALTESEARFRQLFEEAPDAMFIESLDDEIVDANDAACRLLGYSRDELRSMTVTDIQANGDGADGKGMIAAELARGPVFEGIDRRRDGTPVPVEIHNRLMRIGGRDLVLSIVRDITERKRAEAERARLHAALTEKNAELEQVVYVASHDLRSPLVNIDGYSRELAYGIEDLREALGETVADPKVSGIMDIEIPEALRFIRASASKMDTLLSGLLRLSRSGRAALSITDLDMNILLFRAVDAVDIMVRKSGATLTVENLPPCRGDAVQVGQVFSNLLDNALKYLDPDRPGVIRVSGRTDGDRAVYFVDDNGIGIAPDHQEKIFEIFHRLDPGRSEGEGLGLTIVSRILGRLDGDIRVISTPGEGSRFTVTLPAAVRESETP